MKVSIIIPVYQVEKYIDKCLQSIICQTYEDLDIILVDDGSKDLSGDICEKYSRRGKRIKVVHKSNGGLMSAWLKGLQFANGEYLFFVDSDDWIDRDSIEKLVDIAEVTKADIICCNYYIEYEGGRFPDRHTVSPGFYKKEDIDKKIIPYLINDGKYLSRGVRICRWGKLIRKECMEPYIKYCNMEVTIGEDMNIMVPVIANANSVYIMEDSFFYHYRMNNASIMKKLSDEMWNKVKILHDTMQNIITELGNESLQQQELRNYCDLTVMVIGKELKAFSGDVHNLQALYNSDDYEMIKSSIERKRYTGIEKKAAELICSKNKWEYWRCKIFAVFNSLLNECKRQLKKYRGKIKK